MRYIRSVNVFNNAHHYRQLLLQGNVFRHNPLPDSATSLHIFTSRRCPGVRCLHCENMHQGRSMNLETAVKSMRFFRDSGALLLKLTGGGEPTQIGANLFYFYRAVPENVIVDLQTNGSWAETEESALALFDKIQEAIGSKAGDFRVRVSIGKNVQRKIPLANSVNAVRAYERGKYTFSLAFGTAYILGDDTAALLGNALGAKAGLLDLAKRKSAITTDKNEYVIVYTNLRGAQNFSSCANPGDVTLTVEDIVKPIAMPDGDFVLATCLNDMLGAGLVKTGGMNMNIDVHGAIWIFGGSSPDNHGDVNAQKFSEMKAHFGRDVISVASLEGLRRINAVACLFDDAVGRHTFLDNWPPGYLLNAVKTYELALGVSLVLLNKYYHEVGNLVLDNIPPELSGIISAKYDNALKRLVSMFRSAGKSTVIPGFLYQYTN